MPARRIDDDKGQRDNLRFVVIAPCYWISGLELNRTLWVGFREWPAPTVRRHSASRTPRWRT